MSRIKSRDTEPELALRRSLWKLGIRGWRCHRKDMPGRPDIAFGPAKLAVFVDGAFWHGHPSKYKAGQSGEFWDLKIAKNVARDDRANAELAAIGWTVIRLWDFEVMKNPQDTAERVKESLSALGFA